MANIDLCRRLYNGAIQNSPPANTPESLEYGIELAQEFEAGYVYDSDCGLHVSVSIEANFACSQGFRCPLRKIVELKRC